MDKETLGEMAKEIEKTTRCVCDLDKWEPEKSTGHSWVCPIHKMAMARFTTSPAQRQAAQWKERI